MENVSLVTISQGKHVLMMSNTINYMAIIKYVIQEGLANRTSNY